MGAPAQILSLMERFDRNVDAYRSGAYNETQARREFIDPFFKALGWDIDNEAGYAEAYKDVVHEDAIKVGGMTKAPDYCFRIGGTRKFFVEAKKPAINIKDDVSPAFQLRRYAWSAKLPLSILTDFEELAVYDCRVRPDKSDAAATARTVYLPYTHYDDKWDEIASVFSKEAVLQGSFDHYAETTKGKKGTAEVDAAFLREIESWRDSLARTIALRNPRLTQRELNFAVQATIDRIIFLRICEDRGIESYGELHSLCNGSDIYGRLTELYRKADQRYNSGLFHFERERGRSEAPDELTPGLVIDDKALKDIIRRMYYPDSPYEFSVLPADILGQVYEQFLGKVIRLTAGHQAKVEDKPEAKKAGGVYYTPTYIVDYIVKQSVGTLLKGSTPRKAASLRILDPACGSGSFLIGAFQCLMDWHRDWYIEDGPQNHTKELFQGPGGEWRLTTSEKKRVLLNNIYGVDIDAQAVETTKLSLLLKVLEGESSESIHAQLSFLHERALPDLASNVKCGNSLIGPDFYDERQLGLGLLDEEERYRVNVFDWAAEFPQIVGGHVADEKRGFDAVIGNPPYRMVQPHNTHDQSLAYLRANYPEAEFKLDLYHLFLLKGVGLVREDGFLAYIVPTPLLNNVYAETLRRTLMDRCCIETLSVARGQVFASADVHTSVVVLRRVRSAQRRRTHEIRATTELDERIMNVQPEYTVTGQVRFEKTPGHVWNILVTEQNASLLERLGTECTSLGALAQINRGLITGARADFFSTEQEDQRYVAIIGGADVQRYYTKEPAEYVLFERPESAGGCWLPEVHFAPHKLVMRQIGRAPTASLVLNPLAVTGNIFTLRCETLEEEEFLLGLLNSRLMAFYWRTMFADFKSTFPQFTIFSLSQAPIASRRVGDAGRMMLVESVQAMMAAKQRLHRAHAGHDRVAIERETAAIEGRIDRLVYGLYGLTDDEIALVESSLNKE